MSNVEDLKLAEDLLFLFDNTLNDDSKAQIKIILKTPLDSIEAIKNRQLALKEILNSGLHHCYTYHKTDYSEVFYFLNLMDSQYFKNVDFLTYQFQKKANNRLIGHYIQLSYFFESIDKIFTTCVDIHKYPSYYQENLQFIIQYIRSFQFQKFKKHIANGKVPFSAIQFLNKLVIEKRKNERTAQFYSVWNRFEAYISLASVMQKRGFQFPEVGSNSIVVKQMYHPLLPNPIKTDVEVNSTLMLLTGANMSGKSTFLKALGIVVYFAHLGLPVPATEAQLPYYDFISIHINHSDDIKNGLSHFMQEIVNMKEVLQKLQEGKRSFALFDELYKGTNYEDAIQISSLTIAGLRRFTGSNILISTHLYALKAQFENTPNISAYHLDCLIENNLPKFTYLLKEGWTDLKIGELLFEREGIKKLLENK